MINLKGSFVAIVTPFKDDKIDEVALRKIVNFHLESGTSGIVPCGSTGESSLLSIEEYLRVIEVVVEEVKGRLPVLCGTGTNSTSKSIDMIKRASKLGADGFLTIVPYYNKPTQEGMMAHFGALAESVEQSLVIYNIPGRTAINMLPATVAALSKKYSNIIGIKEASGNLDQASEIATLTDSNFSIMSGDDALTLPLMSIGGKGVISVTANILPNLMAQMCDLFAKGETEEAKKIHLKLFPLIKNLFIQTNPIPIKYAMHLMGFCNSEPRLPLLPLSNEYKGDLKKALIGAGIKTTR
ncbi:MAG: 4-hydroxy-tetrahydrodipicolinate synthase [Elusimicrobia bacterium]|nr:4-hydroxy-tetrahydrodipicolinate synthase [Elusimicrobiota bacterium]